MSHTGAGRVAKAEAIQTQRDRARVGPATREKSKKQNKSAGLRLISIDQVNRALGARESTRGDARRGRGLPDGARASHAAALSTGSGDPRYLLGIDIMSCHL